MQAGAMSGLNLETAKSKALEIVDAFPRETDFLFITNDFEQRHNRLVKADAVRLFLQELQLTPVTPTIAGDRPCSWQPWILGRGAGMRQEHLPNI